MLEAADRLTQTGSQRRQLGRAKEQQRQGQHYKNLSESESHRLSCRVWLQDRIVRAIIPKCTHASRPEGGTIATIKLPVCDARPPFRL